MRLEDQKARLVHEKEKLLKQIEYYKKEDPLSKGRVSSGDDDITETEEHDRITATSITLKKDLTLVEEALKRIEQGRFGICEVCGNEIEEARLEVLPTAILCLEDEKRKH